MGKILNSYTRNGYVLTMHSVLKQDYRKKRTSFVEPQISGAPNLYGMENMYSVGQPTTFGVKNVLKFLSSPGRCVWINLREEPVIYINGQPFVLRDKSFPFKNITSFKGISFKNVEEMEKRIKREVLIEAKINNGFIMLHEECEHQVLEECYTMPLEVKTTREVFENLEGSSCAYFRLPLSSHGFTVENKTIGELHEIIEKKKANNPIFIFNSSRGFGRSTFAVILCTLILRKFKFENLKEDALWESSPEFHLLDIKGGSSHNTVALKELKSKVYGLFGKDADITPLMHIGLDGNYKVVNDIMCALLDKTSKKTVDKIIDKYSAPWNIKWKIIERLVNYEIDKDEKHIEESVYLLEKYLTLIIFNDYLYLIRGWRGG
jgi:hypothetical protein